MAEPTADELIAAIQRSELSTVLVEGKTDAAVYRRLEQWLGTTNANFLPCGGRPKLLEIYRRRSEFSDKRVCFVADKDMWIFSGVPQDYSEIILSDGYSIENDLYSDSDIERLLQEPERANHKTMIQEVSRWFAREVEKFRNKESFCTDPELHLLIPSNKFVCCPDYLKKIGFVEPSRGLYEDIASNYKAKLRGKLLYDVLVRFCSASDRPIHTSKGLMETSIVFSSNGPSLKRIMQAIMEKLGIGFTLQA